MGKLDNKIALVTGSAMGIGKAIAIGLAQEGANLMLADIKGTEVTEKAIRDLGVKVESVQTDVTSEQQIENLFSKTMERFGRLDVLVNNAGIFSGGPLEDTKTEAWDKVIATNLRAHFLCTRFAFKIMKAQGGGRIINIGSISGERVRAYNAAYSVAKFGLIGLTHTTSLEGRKFGISCGCFQPGEVFHEGRPAEMQKEPGMTREDAAAAVVFMAYQPAYLNVLELTMLHNEQLFIGRG
jgi:NAD(P)-dependent dehydrogenase (short-subunit alcohol dehydrogenase family)